MEKIKNLSIRKTIILYLGISLICSFLFTALIVKVATYTQWKIWWNYVNEEEYRELAKAEKNGYRVTIPRPSHSDMSDMDVHLSEFCDFLETYTVLILSIAGSCIAVMLFYRNKLKVPIQELEAASGMIAREELDFHITYENQDELGHLCQEFEKMRDQLEENNKTLWRMVENEKAMRTAIAHDIRSPLSVLKGYQEMLLEFVAEGTFDKEKTIEMLQEEMKQIERMDRFIETMRKMNSLEDRNIKSELITLLTLKQGIQNEVEVLSREANKKYLIQTNDVSSGFYGDQEMILEVTENLLTNALRYAKESVEIVISMSAEELEICIGDDGSGFREAPETITKAFYHDNPQDTLKHSGLGMYISRIYCERHDGKLLIGNQEQGGAIVKAIFHRPQ